MVATQSVSDGARGGLLGRLTLDRPGGLELNVSRSDQRYGILVDLISRLGDCAVREIPDCSAAVARGCTHTLHFSVSYA